MKEPQGPHGALDPNFQKTNNRSLTKHQYDRMSALFNIPITGGGNSQMDPEVNLGPWTQNFYIPLKNQ